MKAERIYDAIGEIREDLILDAEQKPTAAPKRFLRQAIAACLAIFLLALPVSAEVRNGYISNLLAPLYGGAQTELVDSIGVPIDASASVSGYTLTADAVIGDRHNIAIVYTLTRDDGGVLEEGICFDKYSSGSIFGGGSGGGSIWHEMSEDHTKLYITQQWTSTGRLFPRSRRAEIVFSDLVIDHGDEERTLVMEGAWELEFIVRYEDTTQEIPVRDLTVTDSNGNAFQIRKILLSPIGIHMDLKAPNPHTAPNTIQSLHKSFTVAVYLKDGTVVQIEDSNFGMNGKGEDAVFNADYGAMFDQPIRMEEIEALIICGTRVSVS